MAYSLEICSEWPLISCVMPTYGRPDYVPEAVACFLEQDYPNKELIVLNDCDGQIFVGDIPEVRIVNLRQRYPTLGDKRNASMELANGELIAVWDDDDLSLPWRLSFSWQEMQRHNTPFYRPAEFLAYWGDSQLHNNQSVPSWASHGVVCFTKQLWVDVGGYPSTGVGEDALFFKAIHRHLGEEFIKYPIARTDRFYIMRGKSDYKHMSINGGQRPLDRSPGTYSLEPQAIRDEELRAAWEQAKNSHGIHAPGLSRASAPDRCEPTLSVCMAVKNRSRLVHEHRLLDLLPRTVRSFSDAAQEIGPLELVIADFSSTDWPLREWLTPSGNLTVKIVDVEGDFSRGRGLNIAATFASSDRLFLTDADVLVQPEAIARGLSSLDRGVTRFPIFKHLDVHGHKKHWEDLTKGLVFVTRQQLLECGGIPEFKSWGGEDDLFYEAVKSVSPVECARDDALLHQWHPEAARHENYVNPRKRDFRRFQRSKLSGKHCLELLATFEVEHSEWVGPVKQINLYQNGYMERPGLGYGSYEFIPQVRLTLNWKNWPAENLIWDAEREVYKHPSKAFRARLV